MSASQTYVYKRYTEDHLPRMNPVHKTGEATSRNDVPHSLKSHRSSITNLKARNLSESEGRFGDKRSKP